MPRRLFYALLTSMTVTILYVTYVTYTMHRLRSYHVLTPRMTLTCDTLLHHLLQGHWQQRAMTSQETQEMQALMSLARTRLKIPERLQLPDSRCGNRTYKEAVYSFRVLCDDLGPTPCCYNNVCTNRSLQQCQCPHCYDLRSRVYAEFSSWYPGDASLAPLTMFSPDDICRILRNSTLVFIGDSLVRHVFMALLMAIRGDWTHGPMSSNSENMPKELYERCSGYNLFIMKECWHNWSDQTPFCGGTVSLKFRMFPLLSQTNHTIKAINKLANTSRAFVFWGIGSWGLPKPSEVQQKAALPVLETLASLKQPRPRLVWMAMHAPGLLKPDGIRDSSRTIFAYNQGMNAFFRQRNITVFDTYTLTRDVRSPDGIHHGLGANRIKVMILLQYLQCLLASGTYSHTSDRGH